MTPHTNYRYVRCTVLVPYKYRYILVRRMDTVLVYSVRVYTGTRISVLVHVPVVVYRTGTVLYSVLTTGTQHLYCTRTVLVLTGTQYNVPGR